MLNQSETKESAAQIRHLAIIMDGNSRWAKQHNLPKAQGYKKGAEAAKSVITEISELNIPYVTLYAFSSENWQRPKEEVDLLMNLLSYYLAAETKNLHKNNIKLKVIGNITKLQTRLKKSIEDAQNLTQHNTKMTVCVALGYGGRNEIINACQQIIETGITQIDEKSFQNYLYDSEMPDVDLLIRTGGQSRISNFLLWQIAYAELFFCKKYWPDFNKSDLIDALTDYSKRNRNFGTR